MLKTRWFEWLWITVTEPVQLTARRVLGGGGLEAGRIDDQIAPPGAEDDTNGTRSAVLSTGDEPDLDPVVVDEIVQVRRQADGRRPE